MLLKYHGASLVSLQMLAPVKPEAGMNQTSLIEQKKNNINVNFFFFLILLIDYLCQQYIPMISKMESIL